MYLQAACFTKHTSTDVIVLFIVLWQIEHLIYRRRQHRHHLLIIKTFASQSRLFNVIRNSYVSIFYNAFYTIPTTFYTHCYPISTQQDTILDVVVMTEFYLQRLDVCRLITFQYVSYNDLNKHSAYKPYVSLVHLQIFCILSLHHSFLLFLLS